MSDRLQGVKPSGASLHVRKPRGKRFKVEVWDGFAGRELKC